MTREESSLEAYVVVGNALHLLVHGIAPEDQQRLGLPVGELLRLLRELEPVSAVQMLTALENLRGVDRNLLHKAIELCERLAGAEAEQQIGAPAETRSAVKEVLLERTWDAGEGA